MRSTARPLASAPLQGSTARRTATMARTMSTTCGAPAGTRSSTRPADPSVSAAAERTAAAEDDCRQQRLRALHDPQRCSPRPMRYSATWWMEKGRRPGGDRHRTPSLRGNGPGQSTDRAGFAGSWGLPPRGVEGSHHPHAAHSTHAAHAAAAGMRRSRRASRACRPRGTRW